MNRLVVALTLVVGTTACGSAADLQPPTDMPHQANADVDWRDQVIYQIMVDRFSDGDTDNNYNIEPSVPGRYHGGDWQGIIDNLDYLDTLGVTALWISPVVRNTEEDAGFASYHGYWTQDFVRHNPHFGDLYKLRELVDAAHARDMLVILDVVTNHVGQLFYYDINGNGRPDDWLSGGGLSHTCVQVCNPYPDQCTADEIQYCNEGKDYLERIIEWDPEYDRREIQGWTSLGFSGAAEIKFTDWPAQNRVPPERPPEWMEWSDDKAWFDDPSWYNRRGRVYTWWHEGDYSDEFVREQETLGDFPGGLKDLDTDNPDVRDALIMSFQYWIAVADFDGFRIDTVKHIDRPEVNRNEAAFWGRFTDAMREEAKRLGKQNFFIFGEAFDGDDDLSGAYTFGGNDPEVGEFGRFDSVFYFSQYYRGIVPVFQEGAATKNLECLYNSRVGRNPADAFCTSNGYAAGPTYQGTPHRASAEGGIGLAPQQVMVNFLDNHDLPRFLFNGDVEQLQSALDFLYTWDGIPCMYYGTEQLFDGGVDPRNREDMQFSTDGPFFARTQALIQLRKDNPALRRGTVEPRWSTTTTTGPDAGIFAFERIADDQTVLVVLNTGGAASETCSDATTCMDSSFSPGTTLTDISPDGNGETFTVAGDGTLQVTVPAHGLRVLIP